MSGDIENFREATIEESDESESVAFLTEWAEKYEVTEDPYVKGLIEELPKSKNLSLWSGIDPFENLPFPKTRNKIRSWHKWFLILRNSLVFIPVAATWLSLREAIPKYSDAPPGTPFLVFWESGKAEGVELASHFRLSFIALSTFVLILIVVGLTFFIGILKGIYEKAEKAQDKEVDLNRQRVALELSRILDSRHWVRPETFEEAFGSALDKLANAIASVDESSGKLQATANRVLTATEGIGGLSGKLDSLGETMANTDQSFAEATAVMSRSFADTANEISRTLASRLDSLGETMANTDQSFAEATAVMSRSFTEATDLLSISVAGATRELQRGIEGLSSTTIPNLDEKIGMVADSNTNLAGELAEAVERFTDLHRNVENLQQYVSNQIISLRNQSDEHVVEFGNQLREQNATSIEASNSFNRSFTTQFENLANGILDRLGEIQESFEIGERSITVSANELERGIEAILSNVRADQNSDNNPRQS